MYGYEYEFEVLLGLRLLKFLHMQSPETAKRVIEVYKELDEDEMCVVIEEILLDIFEGVTFDFDEMDETSIVYFSHPSIDRLFELGSRDSDEYGNLSNAWRRKIQDVSEYYALGPTNSVYHLLHHFSAKGVVFEIKLSPDCYEPILFGNTLIDMILHCQRDLRRLEEKQSEKKVIEIVREEAA